MTLKTYIGCLLGLILAIPVYALESVSTSKPTSAISNAYSKDTSKALSVTDGKVNSIVYDSAKKVIYIGGEFNRVSPHIGSGFLISATTGDVSNTYPTVNGSVSISISDGAGGWYIGGHFNKVGDVTRNNLAHILKNGEVDPAFNPNVIGSDVRTLVLNGNTMYVAGAFSSIGGLERNNIAALDVTTGFVTSWNPNVTAKFASGEVNALALNGNTIYVGGKFSAIGGQERNNIAALDTTTGFVTSWSPNANEPGAAIFALAVDGNTVYAGGWFSYIGGKKRERIAALDATTGLATNWDAKFDGADVTALAVNGNTIYVGGFFLSLGGQERSNLAALDVTTGLATDWNPRIGNDPDDRGLDLNRVHTIIVNGNTIYVGGWFKTIGGQERSNIAALDATTGHATSWNPSASGVVLTLAMNGDTVYAGGNIYSIGGLERHNIAALDAATGLATSWNPNANEPVNTLAVNGDTVYAGGWFDAIGGQERHAIAALDVTTGLATSWNPSASGVVLALAMSGNTVYAGGRFNIIGGQQRNNIAALDVTTGLATSWNPSASGVVMALAVNGDTVYAGGWFDTIGGQERRRIAALNVTTGLATSWNPSVEGDYYGVNALVVNENTVYAGGWFFYIGGQERHGIAALDAITGLATSWDPNVDGIVNAFAMDKNTIYVAGEFSSAGGQKRKNIAALDATTGLATSWNPNANKPVNTLAVNGDTVYAGGNFTSIGGQKRINIAALDARAVFSDKLELKSNPSLHPYNLKAPRSKRIGAK